MLTLMIPIDKHGETPCKIHISDNMKVCGIMNRHNFIIVNEYEVSFSYYIFIFKNRLCLKYKKKFNKELVSYLL